jgi:hypothetical protein
MITSDLSIGRCHGGEILIEYRQATLLRIALVNSVGFSASTAVPMCVQCGGSLWRNILVVAPDNQHFEVAAGPGLPGTFNDLLNAKPLTAAGMTPIRWRSSRRPR